VVLSAGELSDGGLRDGYWGKSCFISRAPIPAYIHVRHVGNATAKQNQ
jgi:hypothetical protein